MSGRNFLLLYYIYLGINLGTPMFWLGSFLNFGQKLLRRVLKLLNLTIRLSCQKKL